MQRIPGAGTKPFNALDLVVGFLPDLVQTVVFEQHRKIEAVAGREREVTTEHVDVDRRGHGGVIALHGIEGAGLHGAEQLIRGHQLIGVEQLKLHFAMRSPVKGFDRRQNNMGAERRAGIGLELPLDRVRRRVGIGRGEGRSRNSGASRQGRAAGFFHESPAFIGFLSYWCFRVFHLILLF